MGCNIKKILKSNTFFYKSFLKVYFFVTKPIIMLKNKLEMKASNQIDKTATIRKGAFLSNSHMGYMSNCGKGCKFDHAYIGRYVKIAEDVKIGLRNHIHSNFTTCDFIYEVGNRKIAERFRLFKNDEGKVLENYGVKIGHDVWIGANAIVCNRVEVGNGAVIGAGAVVTKTVPPYAIVGGVPARVLGYRFSPDVIKKLEESKWWNYDKEEVLKMVDHLEEMVNFNMDCYWENYYKISETMQ